MLKILHTADWHIGKILHRQDLSEEINLFFDWLVTYISVNNINVLLVSGDVFDMANPANKDTTLYYKTISRLAACKTQIIITGGNHDSISLLDSPSAILDVLNVKVIGGGRDNIEEEIIPVYDTDQNLVTVVIAVPFLRDKDLRVSAPAAEMSNSRYISTADAIKNHYDTAVNKASELYGSQVPLIAMGHLFMQGSITSDSEREIHVGNLEGLGTDWIHPKIQYLALGHIHKPQRINKSDHIRYCGSPIFLDFSERNYEKQIIELHIEDHKIKEILTVPIPAFRKVVRIAGDFETVKTSLLEFVNPSPLPAFIELQITEDQRDPQLLYQVEQLVQNTISDTFTIIKSQTIFKSGSVNLEGVSTESISDLSVLDVFRRCMNDKEIAVESQDEILHCYQEILDDMQD